MNINENERHAQTQEIIEQATEAFERSGVALLRQGRAVPLADIMKSAVILDILDSEVNTSILSNPEYDEALPVVGLMPGETANLGREVFRPTSDQRRRTINTFSSWRPQKFTPEAVAESLYSNASVSDALLPISMKDHMGASVNCASQPFELDYLDEVVGLEAKPSAKLAQLLMRPVVALNLDLSVDSQLETVGHELTHYFQKQEKPVRLYSSQKQADARGLRQELEAYHVGAMIKMHQLGGGSIAELSTEKIASSSHLVVELVREQVNNAGQDPFLVTPQMWESLNTLGITIDQLLHGRLDFDKTLSKLRSMRPSEKAEH